MPTTNINLRTHLKAKSTSKHYTPNKHKNQTKPTQTKPHKQTKITNPDNNQILIEAKQQIKSNKPKSPTASQTKPQNNSS